ncbi:hypothetical protein [Ruania halotolerans]|uniref:hypothetical protein n=1 Tax=Ruania halotolerans TaxID=2897773 RepID=UPI001E48BFF1|nr:hypothetical protein [Ruania halotolerans]UFU07311.1 hypothetical protein LQF10_04155 [Ruania halotolerans]
MTHGLVAAAGLAAAFSLGGCGSMESSSALTYEAEVVSGGGDGAVLRVEYITRQTGLSEQQTTGATVSASEATPATFETLALADDEVSISVGGVPDAVLRCAVVQDGSIVLEEQESSAPGEAVTCTASVDG